MSRPIDGLVIHCAATPNGKAFTRTQIDAMHAQRGFRRAPLAIARYKAVLGHALPAIGYHWVIETDGSVQSGRHPQEMGAHVQGSNARTLGVCLIGTDRFSLAQWAALRLLVRNLRLSYPGISVLGHRDYSPDKNGDGIIDRRDWLKTCPGFAVADWLAQDMAPLAGHVLEQP